MHNFLPSRRRFLTTTALAGAGIVCAWALPAPVLAHALTRNTNTAAPVSETRVMLGTFVSISLAQCGSAQAQEGLAQAFAKIHELEGVFSRYDKASPLSVLNAQGSLHDSPPELSALVARAQSVARLTDKAFDPTVKPVVDLFKAHQNPQGQMRLDPADLDAARQLVGFARVRLDKHRIAFERSHMGITLDGIAKGHIIDRVSALLVQLGLPNHLINAGGDIIAWGEKSLGQPWTVAVENPLYKKNHGTAYPEVLNLRHGALATSGSYEIFYDASREHHHIIHPASGTSPSRVSSVSVLAPTATEADALATALSVMPPHDALRLVDTLPRRECCILGPHGLRMTSRGWKG
ncbi:MAG: FAD:protein FMN transferase [Desulfovibrionaceae bacterium]